MNFPVSATAGHLLALPAARAFGRALESKLLQDLGLGAAIVLAIYLVLKVVDLLYG